MKTRIVKLAQQFQEVETVYRDVQTRECANSARRNEQDQRHCGTVASGHVNADNHEVRDRLPRVNLSLCCSPS